MTKLLPEIILDPKFIGPNIFGHNIFSGFYGPNIFWITNILGHLFGEEPNFVWTWNILELEEVKYPDILDLNFVTYSWLQNSINFKWMSIKPGSIWPCSLTVTFCQHFLTNFTQLFLDQTYVFLTNFSTNIFYQHLFWPTYFWSNQKLFYQKLITG